MQPPKPYREKRPWGEFIEFTRNSPSTVKILTVKAGEAFSLQKHSSRDEFWKILSGNGEVHLGDKTHEIIIGQEYFIPRNTNHRVVAGSSDVQILEISFGNFEEKDIVRLQDKYNRK